MKKILEALEQSQQHLQPAAMKKVRKVVYQPPGSVRISVQRCYGSCQAYKKNLLILQMQW
ncbi:MAG: hypothetical protein ACLT0W_03940 [Clostridium sp.]